MRNRSNTIGHDSSATVKPQPHEKGWAKTIEATPWTTSILMGSTRIILTVQENY